MENMKIATNQENTTMKNRAPGLDLLRCLGLFLVVSFHGFLCNGYYYEVQQGMYMWLAGSFRWFSCCCIGLFLMLTGYLKSDRTHWRDCWKGLIPVLLGYCLTTALAVPYRHFYMGETQSVIQWIRSILRFTVNDYSWYVPMYIGLTLISPFVNLLLQHLHNTRQLLALAAVLLGITAVPGIWPGWLPDYWYFAYPLSYYVLGATVRRLQPKLPVWLGLLGAAAMALVMGTVTVLRAWGTVNAGPAWEFGDVWIVWMVLCLFLGLYRVKLPGKVSRVLAVCSGGCYGGFLLSWMLDNTVYRWGARCGVPINSWQMFLCVTIPIFLVSLGLGILLQYLTRCLIRCGKRILKRPTAVDSGEMPRH